MGNSPLLPTPVQTTYSFKDLTGSLANPALGTPFPLVGGNIGNGSMAVRMGTQRTEHDVAADGVVMPSYVAGSNGEITVECQQTSQLHKLLLSLYNTLVTQANSGDISGWAATVIRLRTVLDGSGHILNGVSFQKIPDKPYESKGRMVVWTLMAADIQNM